MNTPLQLQLEELAKTRDQSELNGKRYDCVHGYSEFVAGACRFFDRYNATALYEQTVVDGVKPADAIKGMQENLFKAAFARRQLTGQKEYQVLDAERGITEKTLIDSLAQMASGPRGSSVRPKQIPVEPTGERAEAIFKTFGAAFGEVLGVDIVEEMKASGVDFKEMDRQAATNANRAIEGMVRTEVMIAAQAFEAAHKVLVPGAEILSNMTIGLTPVAERRSAEEAVVQVKSAALPDRRSRDRFSRRRLL